MTDRMIRPPDPAFDRGLPSRVGRYSSALATRILLHCYLRDASIALDLTYAAGRCWSRPLPPGLVLLTNNWDPAAATDHHVDFRETGLPDRSLPAVLWDPPHLDDLGADSFMRQRYGTVIGAGALREMITAGAAEAWRICSVGLIVKVLDGPHGGRFQQLTRWVEGAIGAEPCGDLTTTRASPSPRPAGELPRVPRSNAATWLVFRRDSQHGRYPDFVRLYERQEASRLAALAALKRCPMCDSPMGDRRPDATTCSDACRQRASRQRRSA